MPFQYSPYRLASATSPHGVSEPGCPVVLVNDDPVLEICENQASAERVDDLVTQSYRLVVATLPKAQRPVA